MSVIEVGVDSDAPAYVTISRVEYKQLKKDAATLNALEAGGVDNWEGYSDALALIDEDEDEDEE